MGKAPYSVMVPRYSDGEIIYRHNNHGFSWIPEGIRKVEGEIIDRSTAYYKDAYADGISLEVFLSNNRIKKNIVIEKPIYSTSDFIEFRFKMPFDNITGFNDGLHIRDIGELKFIHALMRLCQDDYSATYIGPASIIGSNHCGFTVPIRFEHNNYETILIKRIPIKLLKRLNYPIRIDSSASYTATAGDGYCGVRADGETSAAWVAGRTSSSANWVDYTTSVLAAGTYVRYRSAAITAWSFFRAFYPFDTSALSDGAMVSDASLQLFIYAYARRTSCLSIVKTFESSTTTLSASDYNDCGYDIGNDTSGRAGYSPTVTGDDPWYVDAVNKNLCSLNETGISWIDKAGVTKLGCRGYHDCVNIPSDSYIQIETSEVPTDDSKPQLSLEYSNTLTTTHGTGGLGWGGWNIPTIEQTISPTGGFGIGGGALTVKPITWDTSNAVSLISKVANPISYSPCLCATVVEMKLG